ncbi:MAG: hypothetical protein QOH63_4263 [Acidobacteriota bacterium]|nr:hypothetical protein [Acidobacteriota bacterium]
MLSTYFERLKRFIHSAGGTALDLNRSSNSRDGNITVILYRRGIVVFKHLFYSYFIISKNELSILCKLRRFILYLSDNNSV